jgi:hypothetical protein
MADSQARSCTVRLSALNRRTRHAILNAVVATVRAGNHAMHDQFFRGTVTVLPEREASGSPVTVARSHRLLSRALDSGLATLM